MRLGDLLDGIDVAALLGDPATEVTGISFDHRKVAAGDVFCCLRGASSDGHGRAPAAVAAGAVALLCERALGDLPVAQAIVADARVAMAPLAAAVYGHPSRSVAVVGVTGTNGKTTTTALLAAVLGHAGRPTDAVGTLSGIGTTPTTPEAPDLQAALARARDAGRSAVAIEVSSHAMVRHRVDAIRFACAVFTNLSQDHLDEHGTMEAYFRAKASLFEPARTGAAVIVVDDPWAERLAAGLDRAIALHPCSIADAEALLVGAGGSSFRWRGQPVTLRLGGRHNVSNAVAAATAASVLGVDDDAIAAGLSAAAGVDGRFEPVLAGQPFAVLVDYSHTPDALRSAIEGARSMGPRRVLVVFGAGGDRDPSKRGPMGEVVARLADVAVLTSDNPRSEDPMAIIDQVREGAAGVGTGVEVLVEPDRAAAIGLALSLAAPDDVVLIAGKGHETYQEVRGIKTHFDDREVARQHLARLFGVPS